MAEVMINTENFEEVVLKSDKPVVVDFFATWCGPCRMLRPLLEELSEERTDCNFGSVKIDDEDELGDYNIMSIPTIKIFKNGEAVKTAMGVQTREMLLDLLEG